MKQSLDERTEPTTDRPDPTRRPRLRGLLGNRDVRIIVGGRTISFIGDQIAVVAVLMYAYAAGWGTTGVSAVLVASTVPLAFGSPIAGMIVDRVPSRLLTVATSAWEGACVLGLAAVVGLAPRSPATTAALLALLFGLAAGQAVSGPAWTALVPAICAKQDIGPTVGMVQAATTLSSVIGPALGGLIVAQSGTVTALLVDAATFVALMLAAAAIHGARVPEPGAADVSGGMWAGFRVIAGDTVVGPLVLAMILMILSLHVIIVLEVFLVTDVLGGGARAFGVMGAMMAAGTVLGSLAGGRVDGTTRRVRAVVGSLVLLPVGVLLAGLAPALAPFGGAMALAGLASGFLTVCLNAILLTRIADAVRGRVLAAVIGTMQACNLVGMVIGGPLGRVAGPRAVFVGAGCAGLLVCAIVVLVTRRVLVHGVPEPVHGVPEPAPIGAPATEAGSA